MGLPRRSVTVATQHTSQHTGHANDQLGFWARFVAVACCAESSTNALKVDQRVHELREGGGEKKGEWKIVIAVALARRMSHLGSYGSYPLEGRRRNA